MNNITFTGLNNLKIGKSQFTRQGVCIDNTRHTKSGNIKHTYLQFKCNLTDDKTGLDLTDLIKTLLKCKSNQQARSVAHDGFENFELIVKRREIDDIANSEFVMNGVTILPNDKNILPLFTYLASFTRRILQDNSMSDARKECARVANQSIYEEAMKFIENMN